MKAIRLLFAFSVGCLFGLSAQAELALNCQKEVTTSGGMVFEYHVQTRTASAANAMAQLTVAIFPKGADEANYVESYDIVQRQIGAESEDIVIHAVQSALFKSATMTVTPQSASGDGALKMGLLKIERENDDMDDRTIQHFETEMPCKISL
jgi:hypothetical protein